MRGMSGQRHTFVRRNLSMLEATFTLHFEQTIYTAAVDGGLRPLLVFCTTTFQNQYVLRVFSKCIPYSKRLIYKAKPIACSKETQKAGVAQICHSQNTKVPHLEIRTAPQIIRGKSGSTHP